MRAMLGRLASTPSGTRGSYSLVTEFPAGKSNLPLQPFADPRLPDAGAAGQRHPGPGCLVERRVHDDACLGQGRDVELAGRQAQHPGPRVQVGDRARLRVGYLVPGPQLGELTAQAGQAADVLLPVLVADVPAVCGPQPGHQVADVLLVLG